MARGRMLNNSISWDKAVHRLSSDLCRLAFSWTIPYLDVEGRITGDPQALRSKVFPLREDITTKIMAKFIGEWASDGIGLAVAYEVGGEKYLWFPKFKKNQPGLRYEKEPPSTIPPPPNFRPNDVPMPPKGRPKGGIIPPKGRKIDAGSTPELRQNYAKIPEECRPEHEHEGEGECTPPSPPTGGTPSARTQGLLNTWINLFRPGSKATPQEERRANAFIANLEFYNEAKAIAFLVAWRDAKYEGYQANHKDEGPPGLPYFKAPLQAYLNGGELPTKNGNRGNRYSQCPPGYKPFTWRKTLYFVELGYYEQVANIKEVSIRQSLLEEHAITVGEIG